VFDSVLAVLPFDTAPKALECLGSDASSRFGSRQQESNGTMTGECVVCRGRFRLAGDQVVPAHRTAMPLESSPTYPARDRFAA
jgi:hypothetical protein